MYISLSWYNRCLFYKVIDIDSNYNGDQTIALEGIDEDDYGINFYNSKRFIKDVKVLRKEKLKKIQKNQKYYDTKKH